VLNATSNKISVISYLVASVVILVEEKNYIGKTINLVQITYKFDHMKLYQAHLATGGIKLTA